MKPTFLLLHGEAQNLDENALCHLILQPVYEGVILPPKEFIMNPEAPFDWVASGIPEYDVLDAPKVADFWPDIEAKIKGYPLIISSADGYTMRALHGTLSRLDISFDSFDFFNAKAIIRKTIDSFTYNLNYLSSNLLNVELGDRDPLATANIWARLVVKGLEDVETDDLGDYLEKRRVIRGSMTEVEFKPSGVKYDYSKRKRQEFDASGIKVDPQPRCPFFEANVVFTGKLDSLKRDEAREAVIHIGGFAPERLTTETDFLVVGEQNLKIVGADGLSGKMKTAKKYREKGSQIEVISEEDFLSMIKMR